MTIKTIKFGPKECGANHPTKKNVHCRMTPGHDGPHWHFDINPTRKNAVHEIEWEQPVNQSEVLLSA
jgi:hypothetical protein